MVVSSSSVCSRPILEQQHDTILQQVRMESTWHNSINIFEWGCIDGTKEMQWCGRRWGQVLFVCFKKQILNPQYSIRNKALVLHTADSSFIPGTAFSSQCAAKSDPRIEPGVSFKCHKAWNKYPPNCSMQGVHWMMDQWGQMSLETSLGSRQGALNQHYCWFFLYFYKSMSPKAMERQWESSNVRERGKGSLI